MVDWEQRYREAEVRLFGAAPNEYLRQVMARSDVAPTSALCLADGDGRNGTWLAARGLQVTAVDMSRVATDQARAFDHAAGVSVLRLVADLKDWTPAPAQSFDAVFLFYLQCEEAVRAKAIETALSALRPGGWFAAEGFSCAGTGLDGLGPTCSILRYDFDTITQALGGCDIIEAFQGWTRLDEGPRHQGKAHVLRILARRK